MHTLRGTCMAPLLLSSAQEPLLSQQSKRGKAAGSRSGTAAAEHGAPSKTATLVLALATALTLSLSLLPGCGSLDRQGGVWLQLRFEHALDGTSAKTGSERGGVGEEGELSLLAFGEHKRGRRASSDTGLDSSSKSRWRSRSSSGSGGGAGGDGGDGGSGGGGVGGGSSSGGGGSGSVNNVVDVVKMILWRSKASLRQGWHAAASPRLRTGDFYQEKVGEQKVPLSPHQGSDATSPSPLPPPPPPPVSPPLAFPPAPSVNGGGSDGAECMQLPTPPPISLDCRDKDGNKCEQNGWSELNPEYEQFAVCQSPSATESKQAMVVLSPDAVSNVTWKGWGTSLAWFANFIGGLPAEDLNRLLDLLFLPPSRGGLGLSIVRYNIGGGRNASLSPQFDDTCANPVAPYRAIPGFRPSSASPYNWSADERQRRVLLGAKSRGIDNFVAFANSPPWWMTVSGDVAGGKDGVPNLADDSFEEFAEYLTDVVQRYKEDPQWNVSFGSLEPFNEGVEGFWFMGNLQEGCNYSPENVTTLIPLVAAALAKKNLSLSVEVGGRDHEAHIGLAVGGAGGGGGGRVVLTELVGIDSWVNASWDFFRELDGNDAVSELARWHVHGYTDLRPDAPEAAIEETFGGVREVAARKSKEVWVSEWGPLLRNGTELGLALFMARSIIESINILRASAWMYWQVIDSDPSWTLLHIPWNDSAPLPRPIPLAKGFWVLQQFVEGALPGSHAVFLRLNGHDQNSSASGEDMDGKSSSSSVGGDHDSGGDGVEDCACEHGVAAFVDSTWQRLTVFVVNQRGTPFNVTLNISGFAQQEPKVSATVRTYRTSARESNELMDTTEMPAYPQFIHVQAKGNSFTSVILDKRILQEEGLTKKTSLTWAWVLVIGIACTVVAASVAMGLCAILGGKCC